MACELLSHSLNPGPLYGRDPRGKLLVLFCFTPAVFLHSPILLAVDFLILTAGIILSGPSPVIFFKESRGFLFILIFFFLLRVLNKGTPPGESVSGNAFVQGIVDVEGIPHAALFVIRLFLVYTAGVLFTKTTPPRHIQGSIAWFLKPLPGTAAYRLGTAFGLVFTIFPLLMEESSRIKDAQRCRGSEAIRNPVKKILSPLHPLFVNALSKTILLAEAMEARGWNPERHRASFKIRFRNPGKIFFPTPRGISTGEGIEAKTKWKFSDEPHSQKPGECRRRRGRWKRWDSLFFFPLLFYLAASPLLYS